MTSKVRIISSSDIDARILPNLPLPDLLVSQAKAFRSLLNPSSTSQCPPRLSLSTPHHTQLFMPARTEGPDSVVKVVSVPNAGVAGGIPGVNLLFDDATGKVTHMVNSTKLTALRTAAGSLLSSVLALGRQGTRGEVKNMVVFGDGAQALFHVWLHLRYFTSINSLTIVVGTHRNLNYLQVNRKWMDFRDALTALLGEEIKLKMAMFNAREHDCKEYIQRALGEASIICTCTPSTRPLFESGWLSDTRPVHVCAVGSYKPHMCEIPPDLVRSARVLVDSAEACAVEAGCLLQANVSAVPDMELGRFLPETRSGIASEMWLKELEAQAETWQRGTDGRVSIFKSVGVGLQDVEVTKLIVELAGIASGTLVDL